MLNLNKNIFDKSGLFYCFYAFERPDLVSPDQVREVTFVAGSSALLMRLIPEKFHGVLD
jgi:hypothetical protein